MFCPNCGRKCKESDQFCGMCETRLSTSAETPAKKSADNIEQSAEMDARTAWQPGMPCPFCGGNELKGNRCAYCDGVLIVEEQEKKSPFPKGDPSDPYVCPKCGCGNAKTLRYIFPSSSGFGRWLTLLFALEIVLTLVLGWTCKCPWCGNVWRVRRRKRQ